MEHAVAHLCLTFVPLLFQSVFDAKIRKEGRKKGDSVTEVGGEEQELKWNVVKTAISAGNIIKNSKKEFCIYQGEFLIL